MRSLGLSLTGTLILSLFAGSIVAVASEKQEEAAQAWAEVTSQVYADRDDWESFFAADHEGMSKQRLRTIRRTVRDELETLRAIGLRPCYAEAYRDARLGSLRLIDGITDLLVGREGLGQGGDQIRDGADMIRFYWEVGDYGHCSVRSIAPEAEPAAGSGEADNDVAVLFPSSIGGRDIEVRIYSGSDWLSRLDPDGPDDALVIEHIEDAVASLGTSLDDVTVGTAHDDRRESRRSTITAVRIPGAAASDVWETAIALTSGKLEHPEMTLSMADGECVFWVERSLKAEIVHSVGDTVWLVSARDGATLDGIMADLPPMSTDASAVADLIDVFPSSLEGRPVDVEIVTGPEWLAGLDTEDVEDAATIERAGSLVASLGASIDDLTVGTGREVRLDGTSSTITAVQVRDAAAWDLFEPAISLIVRDIERPNFAMATICGKGILGVTDVATPDADPIMVYPTGDTVWFVDIPDLLATGDLERLSWIVASLPPVAPAERSAAPTVDLEAGFPSGIAGQPWTDRHVASGADSIPLVAPLPFNIDTGDRAAAAFLSTGARLDDLTVAFAMAGEDPDVLLIALQIAGEDEAVMRTHLEEFVIPLIARSHAQKLGQDIATVAGKEVTRLWDAKRSKRENLSAAKPVLFHVSDDTIWAVFARKKSAVKELLDQLPS